MTRSPRISRPLLVLLIGALALAAGVTLAREWLPEWQPGLRDRSFYVQRYRELARRAGIRLASSEPRVTLMVEGDRDGDRWSLWLDRVPAAKAAELGEGLRVGVTQPGSLPGGGNPQQFSVDLSPAGQPLALRWSILQGSDKAVIRIKRPSTLSRGRIEALASLLLAPGERLGSRSTPNEDESRYTLPGSDPPQHLIVEAPRDQATAIRRELGRMEPERDQSESLAEVFALAVPRILGALMTAALFFFLAFRRRLDYANGLFLAALSFAASLAGAPTQPTWQEALAQIAGALFLGLWIVAAWSTGESYLRSVRTSFSTSLDSLRARRLGPRGGRALLYGMGLGATLAGLLLGLLTLSAALPGIWPGGPSFRLPPLEVATPFSDGALLAASVALGLALSLRYLPELWAPWAAAVASGLFLNLVLVSLNPIPAGLAANLAVSGFLVWVLRRFGLTTALVAAIATFLLPAAVFSALHLVWLPVGFAVTAAAALAVATLGWVGLGRPEQIELEGRKAPAFIRRIEEERRLKYEMDLLARMQLGLLPARVPEVPGWEIAVRTLLATEAGGDLYDFLEDEEGGFWIAAGDVAGHGYSCSIAQSMTTASLASLIHADQNPPGVLQKIDQVLRRNAAHRHFTSLALMRLDPRTGAGTLANAGHPFPLLVTDGEVTEIAAAGLPLGQGPRRQYRETPVEIPPGGVLVLCSDGLFEGTDWQEVPYGYDRPRDLLRTLEGKPAAEILEALFADWRRHLGAQEHQDDTTVVVFKRL